MSKEPVIENKMKSLSTSKIKAIKADKEYEFNLIVNSKMMDKKIEEEK